MAVNGINVTTLSILRDCVFNPPDGHCNQYEHKPATPKAAIATKLFHLFIWSSSFLGFYTSIAGSGACGAYA